MKKKVWLLVLNILAVLISPTACAIQSKGHEIQYQVSALGNLVYQLDCMATVARFQCSKADFNELWQSEIQTAEKDASMLERWSSLRSKLNETVEFGEHQNVNMATSPNYPMNSANQLNVLQQTRIIAFAAGSIESYQQHLNLLLSPAHVQFEIEVLHYFWPRFEPWFKQQQPGLDQFVSEANQLTEKNNINELLDAMLIFYQADLPQNLILPVFLVAHPKTQASTSGLVFGQNSIIEVLKGEKAINRVAVVIHEIAHFYHENAPATHHAKTMSHFTNPNSNTGKVGYYLFNEAMATAIGNGVLEQRFRSQESFAKYLDYPMSFYNNKGIDQSAKAALNLVETQISNKQPTDQVFLQALDEIWSVALNQLKDTPKENLRHVGIINLSNQGDDLINQLFGLIKPSSAQFIDANEVSVEKAKSADFLLNQYPLLDVLILADHWDQLIPLQLKGLNIKNNNTQDMQIIKSNGAVKIVVVSPTADFMINSVARLLNQETF